MFGEGRDVGHDENDKTASVKQKKRRMVDWSDTIKGEGTGECFDFSVHWCYAE